ncbi:AraC family transcriptional regulator [Paenibacillus spongiae]|uniref:AraC family transcriptional regulator n=1 Tax=Paenibacillus spongiae TaxID=2909671 RepID=A0ABY5S952_9BACL|nr:AraC family transcriptional regulator [Paenibacillus spongiae]UVI29055.1 AraC family transcriptional regulator [Paenibacillus spongiae]
MSKLIEILDTHRDDFIPNWHNRLQQVSYNILVLVTEGQLLYRLNDRAFIASKGDLLFIPSGTMREAMNDKMTLHQKYAVIFTSSPLIELPLFAQPGHVLIRPRSFEYFKEKMMLIYRHSIEKKPFYDAIRAGIMLELLGMACRELDSAPLPLRKANDIRKIEQHILDRFRERISLQELAGLIERSPNYTLSLFKEATGQTPLAYMHRLRITAAKELLRSTSLTVKDISEHLGYYDTSYFYRMFKKSTGLSPSEYAEQPEY